MSHPLSGIVIVTVAINLPGPLAASRLAELGARVIKVEPPTGDPLKSVAPAWYAELTAGQEVIELDLKSPSDRSRFEDLLADAAMLLTSMRPSALARLNIEEILKRRGIALVEIVGHDGPQAEQPGHDLTYQATQGTLQPPALPLVPIADVLGAERAVVASLSALRQRDQGETDVRERVVLEEAARAASAGVRHGLTSPGAILGGASPLYGIYATADGFLAVAALEPHFAARLAAHVGQTGQDLTREFALHPTAHWTELGLIHDIPLVAVREAASAVPELALALALSLPTNNHESE